MRPSSLGEIPVKIFEFSQVFPVAKNLNVTAVRCSAVKASRIRVLCL
jgi:hypothetical protein